MSLALTVLAVALTFGGLTQRTFAAREHAQQTLNSLTRFCTAGLPVFRLAQKHSSVETNRRVSVLLRDWRKRNPEASVAGLGKLPPIDALCYAPRHGHGSPWSHHIYFIVEVYSGRAAFALRVAPNAFSWWGVLHNLPTDTYHYAYLAPLAVQREATRLWLIDLTRASGDDPRHMRKLLLVWDRVMMAERGTRVSPKTPTPRE